MSWIGSNLKWLEELHQDQQPPHRQQQLHPQLMAVDHLHGRMTNGVMMKTTMPIVTGMVVLVVTMTLLDTIPTALHVNVLIPITVVQPRKPLLLEPLLKPLFQPPRYQLKDVDPLAGPLISGVMMKTTIPSAIMMVELVASTTSVDGIPTAQIVNAKSVHPLDGTVITFVTMVWILTIANGMVEIAAVMLTQATALTVHALILTFQQPQQRLQPPPPSHQWPAVDPLIGPQINGVMTRTTMPIAIGMVELVALMITVDMTTIAMIVNVWSAHHLDGTVIAIVMTISILQIVNMTGEIAVVTTWLLPTARIANALNNKS
jgi:hypothetical protein